MRSAIALSVAPVRARRRAPWRRTDEGWTIEWFRWAVRIRVRVRRVDAMRRARPQSTNDADTTHDCGASGTYDHGMPRPRRVNDTTSPRHDAGRAPSSSSALPFLGDRGQFQLPDRSSGSWVDRHPHLPTPARGAGSDGAVVAFGSGVLLTCRASAREGVVTSYSGGTAMASNHTSLDREARSVTETGE